VAVGVGTKPGPHGRSLLEYHPAISELRRLVRNGELGRFSISIPHASTWANWRTEENILWSFAPHDISAILFLLEETPVAVDRARRQLRLIQGRSIRP